MQQSEELTAKTPTQFILTNAPYKQIFLKDNNSSFLSKWNKNVLKKDYEAKLRAVRDFRNAFQNQDHVRQDSEEIKHNIVQSRQLVQIIQDRASLEVMQRLENLAEDIVSDHLQQKLIQEMRNLEVLSTQYSSLAYQQYQLTSQDLAFRQRLVNVLYSQNTQLEKSKARNNNKQSIPIFQLNPYLSYVSVGQIQVRQIDK